MDATEHEIVESENVLHTFIETRLKHPKARIYLGNPCQENDITPNLNDKSSITRLSELKDKCTIVCHAGDVVSAINYVVAKLLVRLFNHFIDVPSAHNLSLPKWFKQQ